MNTGTKLATYITVPSLLIGYFVNQEVNEPAYLTQLKHSNYTDIIGSIGLLLFESLVVFALLFGLIKGIIWAWNEQGEWRFVGVGLILLTLALIIFLILAVLALSMCFTCP